MDWTLSMNTMLKVGWSLVTQAAAVSASLRSKPLFLHLVRSNTITPVLNMVNLWSRSR